MLVMPRGITQDSAFAFPSPPAPNHATDTGQARVGESGLREGRCACIFRNIGRTVLGGAHWGIEDADFLLKRKNGDCFVCGHDCDKGRNMLIFGGPCPPSAVSTRCPTLEIEV